MKRHSSLIPLSHGHHHGLVLAQRLKRGAAKAPTADWPAEPEAQRDRVADFYRSELIPHFRAEEDLVFPLAETHLPGQTVTTQLRSEHTQMADAVERLQALGGLELKRALVRFGDLLAEHIRNEERVLFERLQEAVPEAVLVECGQRLKAALSEKGTVPRPPL